MIDSFVTGASGFVGRQLVKKLVHRHEEIILIPHQSISSYQLQDFSNFFFLSTYGNIVEHQDTETILRANVGDVRKILNKILQLRFEPDLFLFVSSSSVTLPVQTSYSRTKYAAELMIQATDIPSCIVRPFSVTGCAEQESHLIPTLIRSCMEGAPMDFVPEPCHDYVDVEDVADGLIYLAENKMTGIHELGSVVATSNEQVLEMVEAATGKKANVRVVKQLRDYDTKDWYCREPVFGWKPKKTLSQSIQEMVEAYKSK